MAGSPTSESLNAPGVSRTPPRAWVMLVILGLMYVLSFLDRFILALLVKPLNDDLGISDLQLGLLFGTFFALFYGIVGIPLARFADTRNRKTLIIVGVLVWSCCTMLSSLAHNFGVLAVLRIGLALGEAALTPAAFSILTDSFAPRRRLLAATLFSAAGMAGGSTAFLLGSAIIDGAEHFLTVTHSGVAVWRVVFIAVGAPGILLALLFALFAREPARQTTGEASTPGLLAVFKYLGANKRLYGGLFMGAGFAQIIGYAMVAWGPTLLTRVHGLDRSAAGYAFGMVQLVAAVGGTLVVPLALKALIKRNATLASWLPAVAAVLGAACVIGAVLSPTSAGFLGFYLAGAFLIVGAANIIIIILQQMAPGQMRATLTALLLICISSFGLGVGPPLAALVAGWAGGAPAPLAIGLTATAALGLVGAGLCFGLAAKPLSRVLRAIQ